MMEHAGKISLKSFWETVERRLAACSADDLRAILRTMARETPPAGRRSFLERLERVGKVALTAPQAIQQEDLLADIDDLAEEIAEAMAGSDEPEERYDWYEYDEEDSLGPYETFVEPLTGLFDRAQAAFDYGHLALARAAYEKLFELLGLEDDYGRGVGASDLAGVDIEEARARYLRAIYETEAPAGRPAALYGQMRQLRASLLGSFPLLDHLVQISPRPLPGWEQFLVAWIAFLRPQGAPSGSDADAWLREAVRLAEGTAGLESLARREGITRPRAYLDWFAALAQEAKYPELLAAAQEALQALPAQLPIRAAVADHLNAAAIQLNDTGALHFSRWEAFLAKPTLPRLLDLWESAADAAERAALMRRADRHIQEYRARQSVHPAAIDRDVDDVAGKVDNVESRVVAGEDLLAHVHLLAGDWEAAHRLVARANVLGWSSSSSAQGLVVATFLALLSGKLPGALPPNLAQIWQWGLQYSGVSWGGLEGAKGPLLTHLEHAYAEHIAPARLSADQQERFLAWCLEVMHQRVNAIVGNQHRGSYDKAAVLTAACAEVLRLRGDAAAASALVAEVRCRFPRHRAFLAELESAFPQRRGTVVP